MEQKVQQAVVISGFPATGKTILVMSGRINLYPTIDLDSTSYTHISPGERNPNFLKDYMAVISKHLFIPCILFISTHVEVLQRLCEMGVLFLLVYPQRNAKKHWIDRITRRGTPALAAFINDNWEEFLETCECQQGCYHAALGAGEYNSNIIPLINELGAPVGRSSRFLEN